MPLADINKTLTAAVNQLEKEGRKKTPERIIRGIKRPTGISGPRFYLAGHGQKEYICMNSNSYLGLGLDREIIDSEEAACRKYGVGPGAVRFISGTFQPHIDLEKRLARFHDREDGIIFSSAYNTSLGVILQLITDTTVVVSDDLNHNCIINAIRLARPLGKMKYRHNDMSDLEEMIRQAAEQPRAKRAKRVIIVTDGVFSMRGDFAPLRAIYEIAEKYTLAFAEGVITVMDDSHGVGAFGRTGRGTEEITRARADILVGTLGKAFGVNGGYAVSSKEVIEYLRNTAPTYIFSNPITPAEAAAALKAVNIVDSQYGRDLLYNLRRNSRIFRDGLKEIGFETLEGGHPVVPLITRDSDIARRISDHLFRRRIMATPIVYPVVPKGEEEIRFQVSAAHTGEDIATVLRALRSFK